MAIEVERKFIIKHIPKSLLGNKIKQGYLQSEKKRTGSLPGRVSGKMKKVEILKK